MLYAKKRHYLALTSIFLVSLLLSGCQPNDSDVNTEIPLADQSSPVVENNGEKLVGGDKDEHGCLIAAGYTWCVSKEKCLRTWEEDCPTSFAPEPVEEESLVDSVDWHTYSNDDLGYSVDYPGNSTVMGSDLNSRVEFSGPLEDNEHWPAISIAHYDNDFYRPGDEVELTEWVQKFPELENGEETEIDGLETLHFVQAKSPQAYAADYYYFIKDGQLFQITLLHTANKQDWEAYNKFLESFSFSK